MDMYSTITIEHYHCEFELNAELAKLNDSQLLAQFCRSNDEQAFAILVFRHGPMVLRVCRNIVRNEQDAEDAFQAVFLVLARKSRQVRWHCCVANWVYGMPTINRHENSLTGLI